MNEIQNIKSMLGQYEKVMSDKEFIKNTCISPEIKITVYKLKDNKKSGCVERFKYGSIEYLLTGKFCQTKRIVVILQRESIVGILCAYMKTDK